jgi:hypothetical protein
VGSLDQTMTPAEAYDVRERKQSLFQLSSDPFAIVAGTGHRQSISGAVTGASAAATRRRSSAVAPDHAGAHGHSHSGYDGGNKLETIVSKVDGAPVAGSSHNGESSAASGQISVNNRDSIDPVGGNGTTGEHTKFYDSVTTGHHHDPDSVAPHEVR